jgi:two-component SAPR family response regulator
MIAIAVDDEELMLRALERAVSVSPDIEKVEKFSSCEKALKYVEENPIDVAFLDINMRGMGGMVLAEKILQLRPNSKIVFCTGYEEYAIPAFKIHASGYLMKPISSEDVQGEIDNIKGVRQKEKLIEVKCFGNFEVFVKGEKLSFKRSKTKELFAFLVDRRGAGMTAKQICAVLFPDDSDDVKNSAYLRQLVMDLKNTLKTVGADAVFRHETPCYRIDTSLIKCDYISYL